MKISIPFRVISLILMLCTVILSCKKEKTSLETIPKADSALVTIKVAGFLQNLRDSDTGEKVLVDNDSSTAYFSSLTFLVYNEQGSIVDSLSQRKTTATFAKYSRRLKTGNYTVVVIGASSSFWISQTSNLAGLIIKSATVPTAETFIKKLSIHVDNSPLTKEVALERITARLNIVIEDAIPSNARSITVSVPSEKLNYSISGMKPLDGGEYEKVVTKDIEQGEFEDGRLSIAVPILSTTTSGKVIIRSYDANKVLIGEKIIDNVIFSQNKQKTLKTSLFVSISKSDLIGAWEAVSETITLYEDGIKVDEYTESYESGDLIFEFESGNNFRQTFFGGHLSVEYTVTNNQIISEEGGVTMPSMEFLLTNLGKTLTLKSVMEETSDGVHTRFESLLTMKRK